MARLYHLLGVSPSNFDPYHNVVTSPWISSKSLALLRLLFAFYTFFTLLFVLIWDGVRLHTAQSFFSYFTELSYIGLCAYFWASGTQTWAYSRHSSKAKGYPLQRWHPTLQFLHLLLYSTIVTYPILVTIVYWAILADSGTFENKFSAWSNISLHAFNTIFCLFEIIFANIGPLPWIHLPFVIVLLAMYLGVAYITHATQGFYTYSFLNPQKEHGKLAGWILGILLAIIVIFVIIRYLILLRERVASKLGRTITVNGHRSRMSNDGTSLGGQTDEWEAVERPQADGEKVT